MTESGNLSVNGSSQIKRFDDCGGAKVKQLINDCRNLAVCNNAGAECVNKNRNGLLNADCVSKLNLAFLCKTCRNYIFGNITGCICSGAVNLCGVFAAECAAAVAGISAVCINNNLSARKTAVTLRTADNKSARGVDVVNGVFVKQRSGDCCFDNLFDDVSSDLLKSNLGSML